MNSRLTIPLFAFAVLTQFARADLVILNDGRVIEGEVLKRDDQGVLVQLDYGTFTYPQSQVKDVQESEATNGPKVSTQRRRIPSWAGIVASLAKESWANDLRQIPATVIDTGVLRNVPYISFQCGSSGYELNIYGDLDQPAGFEIGVRKHYLNNAVAKANCMTFAQSVLSEPADRKVLDQIPWEKGVSVRENLKFEITPPSDPDAYGGWWVSVYDQSALNKARASDAELMTITQPIPTAKKQPQVPLTPSRPSPVGSSEASAFSWSTPDLSYARPRSTSSQVTSASSGQVYVRGYYRKDGTYVRPHTRSKQSR